jgi:predicted NACHT family NTPase
VDIPNRQVRAKKRRLHLRLPPRLLVVLDIGSRRRELGAFRVHQLIEMTRAVRQMNIAPDRPQDAAPRPFTDFAGQAYIVLLGDPGAGKTHLFKEAAAAEQARFIKARAFLNTPAGMLQGPALFIDGLDEKRAGRGDRDTADQLVVKLFAVDPPRVRISCRAADWLGESDLAALRPFFEQRGEAFVLHLESLSRSEQVAVLVGERVDADAADAFLSQAEEHGLGDFLENPQNLIMLWRAVQTGSWPGTRKELFELSTKLMLEEFDQERARVGAGSFSVAELRPVAGALCAARLISDVDAISLTDQEGTPDIPGYRSLTFFPPEKVQAALGRRVFDAGSEPETVDYTHRTTAEFLAAEFLAAQVRDGLPFGRVAALIGVDGHPAAELRGLHAWLAVQLPECANHLIEADPYGVLTYGDAASLSPSSCASLVRALDKLSRSNPWFRSGNWQARPIGALARPDMVNEFRAILNSPDAGFGVRSVVVDALSLGTPIPVMLPDLATVLTRQASPYGERLHALGALLRLGDAGKAAIYNAFQTDLGNTADDLRLRVEIVENFYGDPYGPADIIAIVNESLRADETVYTGLFWALADKVPGADIPAILDGIDPPSSDEAGSFRRSWEVGRFYARILVRAWRGLDPVDPARAMGWLRKRTAFNGGRGENRARDLRAAMRDTPDHLRALAKDFFGTVPMDAHRWLAYHESREAILYELNADVLVDIVVEQMDAVGLDSDRRLFLYEIAFSFCYQADGPHGAAVFDDLYARADRETALLETRGAATRCNLPLNYFAHRGGYPEGAEDNRDRQRQEFDQNIQQIRAGAHLGWLTHLARIYFALFSDVDRNLSSRARIKAWLGEERMDAALEALTATLSRKDLPSFADVMALMVDHQHYDWWYALVAGLNERCSSGQGLSELSDDFLKGMLAFDIGNPVSSGQDGTERWLVHPWRTALTEHRPGLVRDAYLAVAHLRLSRNEQLVDGLTELLTEPAFEPYRDEIALDLLRQFPNASPVRLQDLLDAVAKLPAAHDGFLQLAGPVISGHVAVDEYQYDLWLVATYLLSPSRFEDDIRQRAVARPGLVFDLRDRSSFARRGQPGEGALPLPMIAFMAQLTGSLFPETPPPPRSTGDRNPWDASEYFRSLTNMISALPSQAATEALVRLEADPQLVSYKPHILYALANQRQRRRDAEYDRPDWPKTVEAIANRAPATVADLHALLVAHLRDLAHRIARGNTDIYKRFWNVDSYARPAEPRPEEVCRDDLITLLKPSLLPLGITVEPEGHMGPRLRSSLSAFTRMTRKRRALGFTVCSGSATRGHGPSPPHRADWLGHSQPLKWKRCSKRRRRRICAPAWPSLSSTYQALSEGAGFGTCPSRQISDLIALESRHLGVGNDVAR